MDTFIHTSKLQKKYNIHNHYIKFILFLIRKGDVPFCQKNFTRINYFLNKKFGNSIDRKINLSLPG
jgi:hypothetical protein